MKPDQKLIDTYLSGNATASEKKTVEAYLNSFQNTGIDIEDVSSDSALKKRLYSKVLKNINATKKRRLIYKLVAVLVIGLFASATIATYFNSASPEMLLAKTEAGQQLEIRLQDGSTVLLNSKSTLEYPESFSDDGRQVNLKGEAFFNITKQKGKNFKVISNKLETEVLGTSFSVSSFQEEVPKVTVVSGKVKVSQRDDMKSHVLLSPNEQVTLKSGLFDKSIVDSNLLTSWQDGNIIFDNSNLYDIARIIERRFNLKVSVKGDAFEGCAINGTFKNKDIDELLESLSFLNDVEYTFIGDNLLELTGNPCGQE